MDDLPVTTVDASVGTPPARPPGDQGEEEKVPRLGLSHPVGDHVEVLSQQLLAEEEPCRGHCPSHCLGTQPCFRATGALGTLAASLICCLIPHPGWLKHNLGLGLHGWKSSGKGLPPLGAEAPMGAEEKAGCAGFDPVVPGVRQAVQDMGQCQHLPAWRCSPGGTNILHQPQWHLCHSSALAWAAVTPCPSTWVGFSCQHPQICLPRNPASARVGGTASPGLAGSEGGSSPVGRGGRARQGPVPS